MADATTPPAAQDLGFLVVGSRSPAEPNRPFVDFGAEFVTPEAVLQMHRKPSTEGLAVVELMSNSADDPGLGAVRHLRTLQFNILAYSYSFLEWPIEARARVLLTGAELLTIVDAANPSEAIRGRVSSWLSGHRERAEARATLIALMQNLGIVGIGAAMLKTFETVRRISRLSDVPVLIMG
jgi:hypothetical protein